MLNDKNGKPLSDGVVCAYSEQPFSDYADSIGVMYEGVFVALIFRSSEKSLKTNAIDFELSRKNADALEFHCVKDGRVTDLEIIRVSMDGEDLSSLFYSHFHSFKD